MKKFHCQGVRINGKIKRLILASILLVCGICLACKAEAQIGSYLKIEKKEITSFTIRSDTSSGTEITTLTLRVKGVCGGVIAYDAQMVIKKDGTRIESDEPFGVRYLRLEPPYGDVIYVIETKTSIAPGTYSIKVTYNNKREKENRKYCETSPMKLTITVSDSSPLKQKLDTSSPRELELPSRGTPDPSSAPEPEPPSRRRVIIYQCPVGWQRDNGFAQPTPRVFIRAVEVEIDRSGRSGIYKPVAIEIYADPTEGLSDLAGWKLTVSVPYNSHGRDYPLTAENAVFNADGIARIESPDTEPFPMTNLTYIGQVLPGFDYRLFSEKNTRVDFALSCYRGTNATLKQLEALEKPRVVRGGDPTSFEWDDIVALLSKWRVPVAETAPAAPSLSSTQQRLTTMWASLKKR